MPCTVLVGAQWGDEGKGKIIDVLTEGVDIVVRYQGGNNAGHTVEIEQERCVLHLVPSGIFRSQAVCVIGNGVVVDPVALIGEIDGLKKRGVNVDGRLFVSDRAHVVFPYHRALDEGRESRHGGSKKIGTTKRGIGPSYGDKVMRVGLRMRDLLSPGLSERIGECVAENNKVLFALGVQPIDPASVAADYVKAARTLKPMIVDTIPMLNKAVSEGKYLLFEGAQGTMLDIDFGTYPYVTSSNTTVGGACTGTGVPPQRIDRVIGVVKAYTTRVGEGPFPTELSDEIGAHLSKEGNEFGATTGRPRRCGWFDAVVARYSAMVNGIDFWAMTKLDVLDGLKTLRLCVGYECDGRKHDTIPADAGVLTGCKPIYEDHEGWSGSTKDVTRFQDLPAQAKAYVDRICEITGVPLGILSVGPRRANTLRVAL